MKKHVKSLLCLIMALMLVFAVVGCGEDDSSNDDDDEEEEQEDNRSQAVKDAEETVTAYYECMFAGDHEESLVYLSGDFRDEMNGSVNLLNLDSVINSYSDISVDDLSDEQYEELKEAHEEFVEAGMKGAKVVINSSEEKGDDLVLVTHTLTMFDRNEFNEALEDRATVAVVEREYSKEERISMFIDSLVDRFENYANIIKSCSLTEYKYKATVEYVAGESWCITAVDELSDEETNEDEDDYDEDLKDAVADDDDYTYDRESRDSSLKDDDSDKEIVNKDPEYDYDDEDEDYNDYYYDEEEEDSPYGRDSKNSADDEYALDSYNCDFCDTLVVDELHIADDYRLCFDCWMEY